MTKVLTFDELYEACLLNGMGEDPMVKAIGEMALASCNALARKLEAALSVRCEQAGWDNAELGGWAVQVYAPRDPGLREAAEEALDSYDYGEPLEDKEEDEEAGGGEEEAMESVVPGEAEYAGAASMAARATRGLLRTAAGLLGLGSAAEDGA